MKWMVTVFCMVVLMGFVTFVHGQKIESFDDGNFTSNPAWGGTTTEWQIVTDSDVAAGATGSNTLRLNVGTAVVGTQYLSTQRTDSWGTEQSWSFWWGRRGQAGTNANHSIVWLWANEADLTSATVDGYRVRFGDDGGGDQIYLQRVDNGIATPILTSTDSVLNGLTDIGFMVRVTRTSGSVWTLYTSILPTTSGTGAVATDLPSKANTPLNQGSTTDATYTDFSNGYFGFMAVHSTGAAARIGAEFDQLYFDTDADASLPVDLSSFTAAAGDGKVTLRWVTQSEVNNERFDVLKAQERNGVYQVIGTLPGQGNSNAPTSYSFADNFVANGSTYWYKIADVDVNGVRTEHGPVSATPQAAGTEIITLNSDAPASFRIYPAYPNPFNPSTNLKFDIPAGSQGLQDVKVEIYNTLGQKIRTLFEGIAEPATHSLTWDGADDNGQVVPGGVYFAVLTTGHFRESVKLTLVK